MVGKVVAAQSWIKKSFIIWLNLYCNTIWDIPPCPSLPPLRPWVHRGIAVIYLIVTVAIVEQEPILSYLQCNSRSLSGHNLIRNAIKITKSRLLSSVDLFHSDIADFAILQRVLT